MKRIVLAGVALSALGLLLTLLAGFGARQDWWHFRTGFAILKTGAWTGLAGSILSASALRARPLLACVGLALALPACGLPLAQKLRARSVPFIHDISTDTQDPPRFEAALGRRQPGQNSAEYEGPALAALQKAAYPDVAPKVLEATDEQAFERALQTAKDMGWEILSADAARGLIEATATSRFFGFKDDVVIRVRPESGMSRVDVRSASRVGKSDIGANARRIRAYLKRLGR